MWEAIKKFKMIVLIVAGFFGLISWIVDDDYYNSVYGKCMARMGYHGNPRDAAPSIQQYCADENNREVANR
jgi:hypothetical protein